MLFLNVFMKSTLQFFWIVAHLYPMDDPGDTETD
jgi:hypothetical protein